MAPFQNTGASGFQDTRAFGWYKLGIGSAFETMETGSFDRGILMPKDPVGIVSTDAAGGN